MRYNSPPDWPPSPKHIPWHKRTGIVTLFLIFFFPVGLVLLWLRQDWSVKRRGTISVVVATVAIFALASPHPATPANLTVSPAAGQNSSPPSVGANITATTPAATPSPTPSSPSPTPVTPTSVAPTAVAAAPKATTPVYKAPAPVHTTRAPQPPAHTQPPAQSCHPLTNSGKCYTPGETCRSSDHGVSGIDANGDAIKCEDNNGWRWERV